MANRRAWRARGAWPRARPFTTSRLRPFPPASTTFRMFWFTTRLRVDAIQPLRGPSSSSFLDDLGDGTKATGGSVEDLRTGQAYALTTTLRLFTNQYGDDGALLDAVHGKIGAYQNVVAPTEDTAFRTRAVRDQQRSALKILIRTFQGTDRGDTTLRHVALEKLGTIGDKEDLAPFEVTRIADAQRLVWGVTSDELAHGRVLDRTRNTNRGMNASQITPMNWGGQWSAPCSSR